MNCSPPSERSEHRRGRALWPLLLLVLALAPSCRDELKPPPDVTAPSPVTDLRVAAKGQNYVDLLWTDTGEDGQDGTATSVCVRVLAGRAIRSETGWDSAAVAVENLPPAGPSGTSQGYRVTGLAPDSLYGFAVRLWDNGNNLSGLSNPIAERTAPPPPPDMGQIEIHLRSLSPGGYRAAQIVKGDEILVAAALDSTYTFSFLPGSVSLSLNKDCARILPSPDQQVEVVALATQVVVWNVDPTAPVTVNSEPPGADVMLDGAPTGRQTPATLPCLAWGGHTAAVHWYGLSTGKADSVRTFEVGADPVTLDFAYPRRALVELFTATLCTNCPFADAAAESLWHRPAVLEGGYAGVEVHVKWGGSDPFFNDAGTSGRIAYYNSGSQVPTAWIGGLFAVNSSAGHPTPESLIADFLPHIQEVQQGAHHGGGQGPARAAMEWISGSHVPGQEIDGRLKIVLLDDIAAEDSTRIWVLDYKDHLPGTGPSGPENFYKVAREYKLMGTLAGTHGLSRRGDSAIVDVSLPLAWDTRWSEEGMGLIGFLQNPQTKEIYQMAQTALP